MASSLLLKEFNDLALLRRLEDIAGPEGYAHAEEVAEALNLSHKHPVRCVVARFSWLRRYGILEKDMEFGWRLTDDGKAAIDATINQTVGREFAKMAGKEAPLVVLTSMLSDEFNRVSTPMAHMIRREWQFNTQQRKFTYNRRNGRL